MIYGYVAFIYVLCIVCCSLVALCSSGQIPVQSQ